MTAPATTPDPRVATRRAAATCRAVASAVVRAFALLHDTPSAADRAQAAGICRCAAERLLDTAQRIEEGA